MNFNMFGGSQYNYCFCLQNPAWGWRKLLVRNQTTPKYEVSVYGGCKTSCTLVNSWFKPGCSYPGSSYCTWQAYNIPTRALLSQGLPTDDYDESNYKGSIFFQYNWWSTGALEDIGDYQYACVYGYPVLVNLRNVNVSAFSPGLSLSYANFSRDVRSCDHHGLRLRRSIESTAAIG